MTNIRRVAIVASGVLGAQGVAFANTGVPMLFVTLPMMVTALVPIVAVEALILSRKLGLRFFPTTAWAGVSNCASTLLGLPLAWSILVVLQFLTRGDVAYGGLDTLRGRLIAVTWQAPWLIPYEGDLGWMIPAATLSLLVPFCLSSYAIEYAVYKWTLQSRTGVGVGRATLLANLASYAGLAAYVSLSWMTSRSAPEVPLEAIGGLTAAFVFLAPTIVARRFYRSWVRSLLVGFMSLFGSSLGQVLATYACGSGVPLNWAHLTVRAAIVLGCVIGIALPVAFFATLDRRRGFQVSSRVAQPAEPEDPGPLPGVAPN